MSYEVVVIGVSAGGLEALCAILGGLPPAFGFAMIVIQHRSQESEALCEVLERCSGHEVTDAVDKDPIVAGRVYLAPADYHLFVDDGHIALSTEAPQFYSRPSIDLAFESVADEYGRRAIGVVLTGANRDGSQGLRRIVDRGGLALIQDPATADVAVMPLAAIDLVPEAEVLPLTAIAARLDALTTGRVPGGKGR